MGYYNSYCGKEGEWKLNRKAVSGIIRACILVLLILSALTIYVPIPLVSPVPPTVSTSETFEKFGPRVDHLLFKVAGDLDAEAILLEQGEIDVMDSPVPSGYVANWTANSNITMESYSEGGYVAHRTYYPSTVEIPDLPLEELRYSGRYWIGFVNELGVGFHGFWTCLNAHPQGFEKGGVLRQGLIEDVWSFNPVHASEPSDWLVLSRIYEPLIKNHPYNEAEKIPWLCRNWTIGTWQFEGGNCTKITFDLKFKNGPFVDYQILWHDDHLFTAEDVAFTLQYMKDSISALFYQYVEKLDHVEVVDEYTVTVYYQVQSVWALDWAGSVPIIPKHIWENVPPGESLVYDPKENDTVIGTGPLRFAKDGVVGRVDHVAGKYVHLEANPTYFRKYVWPDICDATHIACTTDGWVDLDDIMELMKPGNLPAEVNPDGTWPVPPGAWGEHCDVTKDGRIDIADIMEVAVHMAEPWPPPWYVDCDQSVLLQSIDMRTASPETLPVCYVEPEITHCPAGSNFTIDINIANATTENSEYGVYGWQVFMSFNPSLIEVVDVMEGPWLNIGGDTFGFSKTANDAGIVAMGFFLGEWPDTGVVGGGTLANVTFHVLAEGKCPLHLYMTKLRTFDWNLIHILVVDHTAVDGLFTILGDADGDGTVDALDLFDLSKTYGSEPGDANWNPNCDFNDDEKIDDLDLSDLSKNYGKTV